MTIRHAVAVAVILACASAAQAQPTPAGGPRPVRRMSSPVTALVSPEVHDDGRVTLRLRAPAATQVELSGEILQGKPPQPMVKDDEGVWTITVGPLPPEIWSYAFRVHGLDVPDPSNPVVRSTAIGQGMGSLVEVPGPATAAYDSRPVPHGDVRMVPYESSAMGVTRWLWVYTPPGYDQQTDAKFPVLYLLHGNGETQAGWVVNGRANVLLDNAIADGKATPMIVVMPQGHAVQGQGVGPIQRIAGETSMFSPRFPKELVEEIIPLVERRFRVQSGPEHRAIAGLSMGGGQAVTIGLQHPELFSYVLGFSAATGGQFIDTAETLDAIGKQRDARRRLVWLSCGRRDFLYEANRTLVEQLKQRGLDVTYREREGSHVWSLWRTDLQETLPLLFR